MGRISLNRTDDWHVEHDRQDIRGWLVETPDGERVGHVSDLILDTDSELVEAIVLDDGEEYPARDIDIDYDDRVVYLEGSASAHAGQGYSESRVRSREHGEAEGFAKDEPTFKEHYREKYGDSDHEYSHFHPAYRVGYDYGLENEHEGKDWNTVESGVRSDYESRYGEGTWERVKDAARHAFEHARSSRHGHGSSQAR